MKYLRIKVMAMIQHKRAMHLLVLLSFLEAFILPFSPLVLLIPMSLARPDKAWHYCMIATVASTIGAILGYLIGFHAMTYITPYLHQIGYGQDLNLAIDWYHQYGLWVLFIASIFPIPFKLFTLTSGALHLPFLSFLVTVFIVRYLHFALIPLFVVFSRSFVEKWYRRLA